MRTDSITRSTYNWDRVRGVGQGVTETCWQVFALLIAIRVFEADVSVKQFIPAGFGIGLLMAPIGLSLANRINKPISTVVAGLWILVAFALAGMSLSPSVVGFVICVAAAQILVSQGVPMLTHLYSRNYPSNERGSRLSVVFVIASVSGMVFGFIGGKILDFDVDFYPAIFAIGILAALLCAFAFYRIPSQSALSLQSKDPIKSLKDAFNDKLFRMMLAGWMLIGLGNLMIIPIRVEYLANPVYGINASNAQISSLLISTVLGFRLLSTRIWGKLFDRVNVVTLRMVNNSIFMLSLIAFFFTRELWMIAIACALLGTAFGGGGILWTLYVTKVAPPDKVASYMSVHSLLTGLRMALAPFLGYAIVQFSHPAFAAWIALVMMGISTILFIPLRPKIDALAGELEEIPTRRVDPV